MQKLKFKGKDSWTKIQLCKLAIQTLANLLKDNI